MAIVEVQSVTSTLLPVNGTEVQQEFLNVTKDVEVETQETEETIAEEPEELALTIESPAEVLVVQQTEISKDQESKEVEEVHEAEIPKEEEAVELQEAETPKEKELPEVVEVLEADTVKEEESKELVEEAEPTPKEATEKMEVRAEDATTELVIEGRSEDPAVVTVEESKEAVKEEEKNEYASNKDVVVKSV